MVARCVFGAPTVIATAPVVDGAPFPTLYYLTCPYLTERISAVESAGGCERWRALIAEEPALEVRLKDADAAYRAARLEEGGGVDPAAGVGIAGEREVVRVKCLHAHVAAFLAGIADPIGESLVAQIGSECCDERCKEVSG